MNNKKRLVSLVVGGIVLSLGFLLAVQTILANTLQSSVTVGNAAPSVTSVILNGSGPINLTANTTTPITVTAIWNDNNGCPDITNGTHTVLLYRTGVTSSTCLTTPNNLNCYTATVFTASSSCTATSINTTTTFNVYYFAQATDATSSFPSDSWTATVDVTDPSGATGTASSATTTLVTLNALNVTTSSINYGTLSASSTTQGVNQTTTVQNAGNSSTTLNLSGTKFVSGANNFATTSQHFATSSFTYGTGDTALTDVAAGVSGFLLIGPTSTNPVSSNVLWGVGVPSGVATGTYNATTTFAAVFHS